jgi:hypothetical protein
MNKCLKPVFIMAVLAVFGVANAQDAAVKAVPATAPAAGAAHPVAPTAPVAAPTPAAPAAVAPAVPAAPAAATHAVEAAPAAAHAAEAAAHATPETPIATDSAAVPAPVAEASAPAVDSMVVLIIEEPKKKKRRGDRSPKNEFAVVDVPANFEIQARKVMPVTNSDWGTDNLDTWWGRANLMVLTESENFVGKVHLRMYPGEFKTSNPSTKSDLFQIYEALAWHRGDYVNVKIGRWDNTTRFGSMAYGGYVDAKKDVDIHNRAPQRNRRAAGFMTPYDPENALQLGFNNFSENMSLDLALISSDPNLNKGDLRAYFNFRDLAGLENMNIGIGYRSNMFDEIYSKIGDVTHTIDFGFRMPLIKDAGILKNLNFFFEAALIGLDDQNGDANRADATGSPHKKCNEKDMDCISTQSQLPMLGGLEMSLYRGLDKIVVEAEFDNDRRDKDGKKYEKAKDVLGSIYIQKKLNDRFTLNLGVQSENNTKDFSFAGRLQGRIN